MNEPNEHLVQQQPAPQVVVVKQAGNGFAVTALVLGLIGAVVGLVPIFFLGAWLLGLLAVIFGFAGRLRAKREPEAGHAKMAIAGVILGAIAIILGIIGLNVVNSAVDDLNSDLDQIERDHGSY
jgi:hypothetical protein